MSKMKIFLIVLLSFFTLIISAKDYKASIFGVKSDGVTLNTRSIQKAVDYINENGGGQLVLYVGRYLTGTIQLKSNVTIRLEKGAVLVGTTSVYDYVVVNGTKAIISADNQENIGIIGTGVIEGQGAAVIDNINVQIQKGYLKDKVSQVSPLLIYMNGCKNVTVEQINLWNAPAGALSYNGCKDVTISKVSIKSNNVANSKGIMLSGCDGVSLTNIYFDTSGAELSSFLPSKNVTIVNCSNSKGKKTEIRNFK